MPEHHRSQPAKDNRIEVAVVGHNALVKVDGRATFKIAPVLKRFCLSVVSRGCDELLLNMRNCSTMDSTFMGVLAGVAMWPQTNSEHRVEVVMLNLSDRTYAMMRSLGLDRIVKCYECGQAPKAFDDLFCERGDFESCESAESAASSETLHTMRDAHLDLVRADDENASRFCDVLTYLDQEIRNLDR